MWYLREAAKKASSAAGSVFQYSKSLVIGESEPSDPVMQVLVDLLHEQSQILPTKKLDQLVNYSYDMQNFEKISAWVVKKLTVFKYEDSRIKEAINLLTIVYYLIKHGASGFVDDFRAIIKMFQNYQKLTKKELSDDQAEQRQLEDQIDLIVNKARHIEILLTDKDKLLKEKQLAMLIKQKVATYSQKKDSKNSNQKGNLEKSKESQPVKKQMEQAPKLAKQSTKSSKVEKEQTNKKTEKKEDKKQSKSDESKPKKSSNTINDILEAYVWKYVDSLDDKIENITEKVMSKFDEYVDRIIQGQKPGEFELGDSDEEKDQDQMHSSAAKAGDEILDKISKQIDGLEIKQEDLLEFDDDEEVKKEPPKQKQETKKPKEEPLIVELI